MLQVGVTGLILKQVVGMDRREGRGLGMCVADIGG